MCKKVFSFVESIGKSILYIIPEACAIGQGSNVVLSLLQTTSKTLLWGTLCVCHVVDKTRHTKKIRRSETHPQRKNWVH